MAGYADTSTSPTGLDPNQWEDWYLNNVPEAGWIRYLQGRGMYGLDPISKFSQGQYGRTYGQYQSAAAQNPNLGFYDWVKGANLDFAGQYGSQSPEQRGDFSDRTLGPRARFMRAY